VQIVVRGVQACFCLIQQDSTMLTNPYFFNGFHANKGSSQGFNTVLKFVDRRVFNRFKDEKITGTDQVTAPNPTLHLFASFWG
jgi:hypothetical protein